MLRPDMKFFVGPKFESRFVLAFQLLYPNSIKSSVLGLVLNRIWREREREREREFLGIWLGNFQRKRAALQVSVGNFLRRRAALQVSAKGQSTAILSISNVRMLGPPCVSR